MIDEKGVAVLLEQFNEQRDLYIDFMNRQIALLQEFLKESGHEVHAITGRIKQRDSLRRKLSHPDASWNSLEEVNDIVGIRIITFFEEDVERVSEIIRNEFRVIEAHLADDDQASDMDRFGYNPRYYVIGLPESRLKLIEYRRFKEFRTEIQVRSLLQHVWAEMQQQMGFSCWSHFPAPRRRHFARIAHLLELTDTELNSLRQFVQNYMPEASEEAPVKKADPTTAAKTGNRKPQQKPAAETIALAQLIRSNAIVREMDEQIAIMMKAKLSDNGEFIKQLSAWVEQNGTLRLHTVENELRRERQTILTFTKKQLTEQFSGKPLVRIWRGISIYMLGAAITIGKGTGLSPEHIAPGETAENAVFIDDIERW
ncbi:MAG: RelA/SpoT domain-containing protein [Magnetococcales bacterium]|nr:RelA/SpoT domain-containing protein [Magnetococcales bacterium]